MDLLSNQVQFIKKNYVKIFLFCVLVTFFFPFQKVETEIYPYKIDKETFIKKLHPSFPHPKRELAFLRFQEAQSHWLYSIIPQHRHVMKWYHLGPWIMWAILGNEDDGVFGEGPYATWQIEEPVSLYKCIRWAVRNPFHNFTFYIIGSAWQKNDEFVLLEMDNRTCSYFLYREKATTVFYGTANSLFVALHGWKPFISMKFSVPLFRFRCLAFCGWRERGNFGLKIQLRHADEVNAREPLY